MKELMVTDGNNEAKGETKATTEAGYIKTAKRIWPYHGLSRVKIRVYDDQAEGDPYIFEKQVDIY